MSRYNTPGIENSTRTFVCNRYYRLDAPAEATSDPCGGTKYGCLSLVAQAQHGAIIMRCVPKVVEAVGERSCFTAPENEPPAWRLPLSVVTASDVFAC